MLENQSELPPNKARQASSLAALLLVVVLVCSFAITCQAESLKAQLRNTSDYIATRDQRGPNDSTVTVYKEPEGWLMKILKEFFSDIDWQAIEKAREQVEKFVRRVDKLLKTFRAPQTSKSATGESLRGRIFNGSGSSSWWTPKAASSADSANLKDMLERVACFVGYMKILNSSNEALAELDTAKAVSNLLSKSPSTHWWG